MAFRWSTGLRTSLLTDKSFKEIMGGGVLRIFSGTQPTTADDTESGTLLVEITVSSGAFTPGTATNGMTWGVPANGQVAKSTSEVWSGAAVATGTAGWFRFYANDRTAGASTTTARFDGSVATSGAQLNMPSTSITAGATTTLDSFVFALPAS